MNRSVRRDDGMLTVAEQLSTDVKQIKEEVRRLLLDQSSIGSSDDSYTVCFPPRFWTELSVEGARIQGKILRDYSSYRDRVNALLRGSSEDSRATFAKADGRIRESVEQNCGTYHRSPSDALAEVDAAFGKIQSMVDQLYSADGAILVVPDTNALLASPDFTCWRFDWCDEFALVFLPTVLSELDELKVLHRNPDVRDKAEGVIRRLKELRRRGDVHTGIPVVSGKITARCVAAEPDMTTTLPWLRPDCNDDRYLASVVELCRDNTRCKVVIVTGDINLQTKASFARIAFCEPPMSPRAESKRGE